MYEGEHIDLPGLDETIEAAREARAYGVNWRGYQVGAALRAFTDDGERIIQGANLKPLPSECGGPRVCAEVDALHTALKSPLLGLPRVRAVRYIVVIAEPQPDDETGRDYQVLVPCTKTCQPLLWHMQARKILITAHTPFVSVNADTGEARAFRLRELLADCGGWRKRSSTPLVIPPEVLRTGVQLH